MKLLTDAFLWFGLHMLGVYGCHKMPDKQYEQNSFLFELLPFEKDGRIYATLFGINEWKDILPDGGSINRYGFGKTRMASLDLFYLHKFHLETMRAEAIHWVGMTTSLVFLFRHPWPRNLLTFFGAILIDLPFIMIQRYNRPRVMKLILSKEARYGNQTH